MTKQRPRFSRKSKKPQAWQHDLVKCPDGLVSRLSMKRPPCGSFARLPWKTFSSGGKGQRSWSLSTFGLEPSRRLRRRSPRHIGFLSFVTDNRQEIKKAAGSGNSQAAFRRDRFLWFSG